LRSVAEHRGVELRPLGLQLETLRESRQRSWTAFRSRVGFLTLPERFPEVVDAVVAFLDGVRVEGATSWNPTRGRWEPAAT
jgi:hypothetical protein